MLHTIYHKVYGSMFQADWNIYHTRFENPKQVIFLKRQPEFDQLRLKMFSSVKQY